MSKSTPDYTLIRSKRRRRSLALHFSSSGELVVRAPLFTPKVFIDRFVRSKSSWINRQLRSSQEASRPLHPHFPNQQALLRHISSELAKYSRLLQLKPTKVKFKQVSSYWGNCSPQGILNFNLDLIYAPSDAVSYVVVHELIHLKHKGHGKRFWALVNSTYPAANEMRRVLRLLSRELRQTRNS